MNLKPSLYLCAGSSACHALVAAIAVALPVFRAEAVDAIKLNNTVTLNEAGSWSVLPGPADVGVWNNTITAANDSALGGNLSLLGIRIADPVGAIIISDPTAATLTLGSAGIDLSSATQNLTIRSSLIAEAPQLWSLAAGRTLNLWTVNTARGLSGAGDITIMGPAAGTSTVVMLPGATGSLGFNDAASNNLFTGSWNIGANATVQTIRNGRSAWGSGTINLNGGTIAQIQGNWTWTNPIALGTGTNSTIANSSTGTNRSLKLQGVISGSGNLTFADTTGAMGNNTLGFIITGANTLSGTVTIPANRRVRVGGVGGDDVSTVAGADGTLGTASVANDGVLTLSHNNTWDFINSVSGAGVVHIGNTGIAGSETQNVTVRGTNSYAGGTQVNNGYVTFEDLEAVPDVGQVTINANGSLVAAGAFASIQSALGSGLIANASNGAIALAANSAENLDLAASGYLTLGLAAVTNATYSGTLTPGSNGYVFGGATGSTLTVSSAVNPAATLTKNGGSTLLMTGTSNYGSLVINAGVFSNSGANFTASSLSGTGGTILLADSGTMTLNQSVATTYAGTLSGTGNFSKEGTGTLILNSNVSPLAGNVTVTNGFLQTGTAQGAGVNGYLGAVSGGRTIAVNAGATLDFRANNQFGGAGKTAATIPAVILNGGTLNSTRFNILGNVTLNDGALLTQATTDSGTYDGYEFIGGTVLVGGTSASTIQSTNGSENHLAGGLMTSFEVADVTASVAPDLQVLSVLRDGSGDYVGAGGLVKAGAGTMVLAAANTYTGATTVSAGNLQVNGSLVSAVTVNTGATLSGSGSVGAVMINEGGGIQAGAAGLGNLNFGSVTFSPGATALRVTAGTAGAILDVTNPDGLIASGVTTIHVNGVNLAVGGDYPVVDYSGVLGGTGFGGFALGDVPTRLVGNLVHNTLNSSIDFHVSAFDKPKWTGAINGNWNTTTNNWREVTSGNTTVYIQGDDVLFDETATGTTSIVLNETVNPAAVTISNSAKSYSFSGTGKISGSATLIKEGSGTVTIANSGGNDYAGATTVKEGVLKFGVVNALPIAGTLNLAGGVFVDLAGFAGQVGSLTGTGIVTNSGATQATLTVSNSTDIEFGGGLMDGVSPTALVKSGGGTFTLLEDQPNTGGTTIASGKLALGNGGIAGSVTGPIINNGILEINRGDVFILGNVISGTGSLSQVGSGTTILAGNNTYTGATTIAGGALQINNGGVIGAGNVTIAAGATLIYNRTDVATLPNHLSGAGAFRMTGAGSLTLAGNNTFTGGATIMDGTVIYGSGTALGNSGAHSAGFTLRGGTVDFNGQSTYNPGPAHGTGSLPNPVLLVNNQVINLAGTAGRTTLIIDSGSLGFGSFAAGSSTALIYDAVENPGTTTLAARFLSSGTSGTFTRTLMIGDSTATEVELDIVAQLGAAPDATGGFGDGKNTTIQKTEAGTLRISAANYFPRLQVSGGKLLVNHPQALGQSRIDVPAARGGAGSANLLIVDGGVVDLHGFSPNVGGLSDGGVTAGVVTNDGSTLSTLTVGASGTNTTYAGILQDGWSPLALTKMGAGTLTLGGANPFTGATKIQAGTLHVTGSLSGSPITVEGGTLGGNGGTVGAVVVGELGSFAPGEGVGVLNVAGPLTLAGSATFEIAAAGGSLSSDRVIVTGAITLGGTLNVTATGDNLAFGDTFDFFDGPSFSGSFATLNLPALDPGLTWDVSDLAADGTLAVVPEPGATVSLLGGLAAVASLRRRPRAGNLPRH